ncbi:hypothetical protein D3C75_738760 [compost metagenome]
MLLRGDRIILCKMQYFYTRHSHLVAGLTAGLLADDSGHIQGAFLGKAFGIIPYLLRHFRFHHNALDIASTIPELQELNFAAGALVIDPTSNHNALSNMLIHVLDYTLVSHAY